MKRRAFLEWAGGAMGAGWLGHPGLRMPGGAGLLPPYLLVPMDDAQTDHLKAYGLAYRALDRGGRAEWFLNYRGGSFLVPGDAGTVRDAALAGVHCEPVSEGQVTVSGGEGAIFAAISPGCTGGRTGSSRRRAR